MGISSWIRDFCIPLFALNSSALAVVPVGSESSYPRVQEIPRSDPPAQPCGASGCGLRENPVEPAEMRLANGEFVHEATDLFVPGVGIDFAWTRTYRSRSDRSGPMGAGWDFTYNVHVELNGDQVVLHDGAGESDVYFPIGGGKYGASRTFCEGAYDAGGAFVLTFPDSGRWVFAPFDGRPESGRLLRIIDRNDNRIVLEYDGLGRLSAVLDTLLNRYTVGYSDEGLITSLSAPHGRTVAYAYGVGSLAESGDAATRAGSDLVSVVTPHSPEAGASAADSTTLYEYASAQCHEALDHNLTRIVGPGGRLLVENRYSGACDPGDFRFDRLVTRLDAFGRTDLTYEISGSKDRPNHLVVIMNDQEGSVTEFTYDARGRRVEERVYTGRANPGQPTTQLSNRPGPSLRQREPVSYITKWEWNDEDLPTRMTKPSGLAVELEYQLDLDENAPRRTRANLRRRSLVSGWEGIAAREVKSTQSFEYADSLGGCCGGNFVTKRTDMQGNLIESNTVDPHGNTVGMQDGGDETEYVYDDLGRLIRIIHPDNGSGHRREDAFTYYDSNAGHQSGRLATRTIDDTALALTTTYEWDVHGKVSREIDPRGNDWIYTRDASGQLIRVESPVLTSSGGDSYRVGYDVNWSAATRILRIDVDHRDGDGNLDANPKLTTWITLDQNLRITRLEREIDSVRTAVEERTWDFRGNPTFVRFGEAMNGNQPHNTLQFLYDTLGRPFQRIESPGGTGQTTTQYDYDGSGNLIRVTRGLESSTPQITERFYDTLGHLTQTVDPMGNQHFTTFDGNGRLLWELVKGAPQSGGSVPERLFEAQYAYDDAGRRVTDEVQQFGPNQAAIGDGVILTKRTFSPYGQLLTVTEDDQGVWTRTYDTANRLETMTDALGNRFEIGYDGSDNVTLERLSELVPGTTQPAITTWTSSYDSLDRKVGESDNLGAASLFGYDSLDNRVLENDRRGNVLRRTFDGAQRLLTETRILTSTGLGGGTPVDSATTSRAWDDTSRCVAMVDPMGNTTRYAFDANNRIIAVQGADGTLTQIGQGASWALGASSPNLTSFVTGYDPFGNRRVVTTAGNSVVTTAYDALDRPTNRSISVGPGVYPATTAEIYMYDGLSRLIAGANDASVIGFQYDSTSSTVSETINGRTVLKTTDGLGGVTGLVYPSGRTIGFSLDLRGRKKTITEGAALIADYDYVGTYRPHRRTNGNGTTIEDSYDAGRRITQTLHRFGTGVFDRRSYTWDAGDNKTGHSDHVAGTGARTWEYDSLERLVRSVRPSGSAIYAFDRSGNRTSVTGGGQPGSYTMSATLPDPADAQMNQYTTTPVAAILWDQEGNPYQTTGPGGTRARHFDYRTRLIADYDPSNLHGSAYTYDVLGRRVSKLINGPSGLSETHYSYDAWQVVQETVQGTGAVSTYVHGHEIDEVVQFETADGEFYLHTDDKFSVQAVTDSSGTVVERYEYDDYGRPSIYDPAMNSRAASAIGNTLMFQGRPYDVETGLYYFRNRFLDPVSGRFVTRDPLGIWHDSIALGNGYTFLGNNPQSWIDPFGLQAGTPKQLKENRDDVFTVFYGIGAGAAFLPAVGWLLSPVVIGIVWLADTATTPSEYCEVEVVHTGCEALLAEKKKLGGLPLKMCHQCVGEVETCPIGTGFATVQWGNQACTTIFQYTTNSCDDECDFPTLQIFSPTVEAAKVDPEALKRLREMNRNAGGNSGGTGGR